jgi:hypothetical protein
LGPIGLNVSALERTHELCVENGEANLLREAGYASSDKYSVAYMVKSSAQETWERYLLEKITEKRSPIQKQYVVMLESA